MGIFGLSLFFMLSAYLIVTLLLRERRSTGSVNLKAFAARRILRIWPLYFLGILLGDVVGHAAAGTVISNHGLLSMFLMATNVYILRHGWTSLGFLAPLWSISVEEQFYLAVPGLARLGGRRALLFACSAILLGSYGVVFTLDWRHAVPIVTLWANSFVQFQFFAVGGMLALWNDTRPNALRARGRLACGVFGLLAWYLAVMKCGLHRWMPSTFGYATAGYLLALLGTTAIFMAVLQTHIKFPQPVLYLGKISFGLYVFHNLMLGLVFSSRFTPAWATDHQVACLAIAYGLTGSAAVMSYHFFELPFLRLKKRFEVVHTRL